MTLFRTVVVGYDGSETAERALRLAAELAREQGAVLHVVAATREAGTFAVAGGGLLAGPDLAVRIAAEEEVAKALARLGTAGAEMRSHVVLGDPVDVILDVAREVEADLIVVGSKGMHGPRRVLGSVPNSVAHAAPCDVLIAKTD